MKRAIVKFNKTPTFYKTWEIEKGKDEDIHIGSWYHFIHDIPFSVEKRYGSGFFVTTEGAEALMKALRMVLK